MSLRPKVSERIGVGRRVTIFIPIGVYDVLSLLHSRIGVMSPSSLSFQGETSSALRPKQAQVAALHKLNVLTTRFLELLLVFAADFDNGLEAIGNKCGRKNQ